MQQQARYADYKLAHYAAGGTKKKADRMQTECFE